MPQIKEQIKIKKDEKIIFLLIMRNAIFFFVSYVAIVIGHKGKEGDEGRRGREWKRMKGE